jgi:hypothetical protein
VFAALYPAETGADRIVADAGIDQMIGEGRYRVGARS